LQVAKGTPNGFTNIIATTAKERKLNGEAVFTNQRITQKKPANSSDQNEVFSKVFVIDKLSNLSLYIIDFSF